MKILRKYSIFDPSHLSLTEITFPSIEEAPQYHQSLVYPKYAKNY